MKNSCSVRIWFIFAIRDKLIAEYFVVINQNTIFRMSLSKVNRVKKSHNINLGKLVGQIPDLKSQDKFLQV